MRRLLDDPKCWSDPMTGVSNTCLPEIKKWEMPTVMSTLFLMLATFDETSIRFDLFVRVFFLSQQFCAAIL